MNFDVERYEKRKKYVNQSGDYAYEKITDDKVAEHIGLSLRGFQLKKHNKIIEEDRLNKIAKYLNVSASWLSGNDPDYDDNGNYTGENRDEAESNYDAREFLYDYLIEKELLLPTPQYVQYYSHEIVSPHAYVDDLSIDILLDSAERAIETAVEIFANALHCEQSWE